VPFISTQVAKYLEAGADSAAGFSGSKCLLSLTLLSKEVCCTAIVFLGNESGVHLWI